MNTAIRLSANYKVRALELITKSSAPLSAGLAATQAPQAHMSFRGALCSSRTMEICKASPWASRGVCEWIRTLHRALESHTHEQSSRGSAESFQARDPGR